MVRTLVVVAVLASGLSLGFRGHVRSESLPQGGIVDALEAYSRGADLRIEIPDFDNFLSILRRTGPKWIDSGPPEDRARRRNAVALLALETAFRASPPDAMVVLEWACRVLREGERSEFERNWMLASIAYGQRERLESFLFDDKCPATRGLVACHQQHAAFRYPEDKRFDAGRVFARVEVNTLTRRPVLSPSVLTRVGVLNPYPPAVESARATERLADTLARLIDMFADRAVGLSARMRVGILHYELRRYAESREVLAPLLNGSDRPYFVYFAHLIRGLGFNSEGDATAAQHEFEAAVRIDPGVLSGALQLGALLAPLGRGADASALVDRALSDGSTIDDPWEYPCPDCEHWSQRLRELHRSVIK